MTIEERIAEIERQLAEVKAEMKPEPTGLIEAVEDVLNTISPEEPVGDKNWDRMYYALAREKRIAEKRERIISDVRFALKYGILSENCSLAYGIKELDEECAK